MGPNVIDGQGETSATRELKLSCGVWEHCTDPPMFVLRILLMVLNNQNVYVSMDRDRDVCVSLDIDRDVCVSMDRDVCVSMDRDVCVSMDVF